MIKLAVVKGRLRIGNRIVIIFYIENAIDTTIRTGENITVRHASTAKKTTQFCKQIQVFVLPSISVLPLTLNIVCFPMEIEGKFAPHSAFFC